MQEIHQNAVEHGWWEKPRTDGTIRSLLHCELSEAVEEYRAKRPMVWHECPYHPGACENQEVHINEDLHCEACSNTDRKPEGIAVELMDFVIRVFDYLAQIDFMIPASMNTEQKLVDWAVDDYQDEEGRDVLTLDVPDFADVLHTEIALSNVMRNVTYLTTAAGLAMAWVDKHGVDPVKVLLEKNEYNKTRPYKHGGKVC